MRNPSLAIIPSPIHHVEGSRAWLRDRLSNRCTLHAVADVQSNGYSRVLRLELRWERDGKTHTRTLTILDIGGCVCDERFEGIPLLTDACLSDLRFATVGMLTRLVAEADVDPVELFTHA